MAATNPIPLEQEDSADVEARRNLARRSRGHAAPQKSTNNGSVGAAVAGRKISTKPRGGAG